MARLKFDSNFGGRDFERQLKRAVNAGMNEIAEELQKVFDGVYRSHNGRPIEDVKSRLQEAWRRSGPDGKLTEPELSEYASAISNGTRIRVKAKKL